MSKIRRKGLQSVPPASAIFDPEDSKLTSLSPHNPNASSIDENGTHTSTQSPLNRLCRSVSSDNTSECSNLHALIFILCKTQYHLISPEIFSETMTMRTTSAGRTGIHLVSLKLLINQPWTCAKKTALGFRRLHQSVCAVCIEVGLGDCTMGEASRSRRDSIHRTLGY